PLPDAPVQITFFNASETLRTDASGVFATTLTVPANASDGVYYVYARFAPQGAFGPSVNFTSIQVVHLPMNITLVAPSLSLAGLSATIGGTARANGTAVSGANVTVDSPWGAVSAVTDASGGFKVSLPVSPFEFAFSRNVTATVVAPQPYIARGTVADSLGLFNILLVALPVAAVAILGYEAVKLGAFEGVRKRRDGALSMAEGQYGPAEEPAFETLIGGHEVLLLYREALIMAAKKLSIRFRPSLTLREALALVQSKGEGPALEPFRTLTQAAEDLLYASAFDQARVESAKAAFAALEVHWR
ncbi:MAG TPA: DUF4129 domain-containing protein, partial [Nitrososphaerales archaeon]|nr:DUF4129 domain-containing protein [Nitrososphaerales archaeon]